MGTKKSILTIVIVCSFFLSCFLAGCSSSVDERINALEETVKALDLKATRAQDVLDIMCLQARYEAIHSSQEGLTWMLFADREDSTYEITHTRLIGYENIKMYLNGEREKLMDLYHKGLLPEGTTIYEFTGFGGTGGTAAAGAGGAAIPTAAKVYGTGRASMPPLHPVSTPNIIVAGDGKTAKATFISFGYERGGWCYGKYANDYIKIDGKWYIWHEKWLRGYSCNYYKSPEEQTIEEIFEWVKDFDENGFPIVDKNLSYNYLWYPGKESMTITAPQPYETWTEEDNNGAWWKKPTVTP